MYSKIHRLPIKEARKRPKQIFSTPAFSVKVFAGERGRQRYGIIIPAASVKKAVKRNFWKRRIADEIKKWSVPGNDFLVIVSPKINGLAVGEIRAALKSIGEKI